jgi:hypothetical protein
VDKWSLNMLIRQTRGHSSTAGTFSLANVLLSMTVPAVLHGIYSVHCVAHLMPLGECCGDSLKVAVGLVALLQDVLLG